MSPPEVERPPRHIVPELGQALEVAGDALRGSAAIFPEMLVPGTGCLRTSILAIWADNIAGLLAGVAIAPRVPVTLDLAVHLYAPARDCTRVAAVGRTLRVGRSVIVVGMDFTADGRPLATSTAAFMPAPDTSFTLPPLGEIVAGTRGDGRLRMPFAERAGCRREAPGVAVLPRSEEGLNAVGSINGGLIALAVEEAALSVAGDGATLASLALRYLRAARTGPAVATAEVRAGLGRVTVRDAGNGDRLTTVATIRTFPPVR